MTKLQNLFLCVFSLFSASCQTPQTKSFNGQYPEIWWSEVSTKDAPGWEILPQAAKKGEVILSKRNELGILSNFAPTPFVYHGKKYASIEGFWQMLKFPEGPKDERINPVVTWTKTREQIAALSAFEAKELGDEGSRNMKKLGIDWVSFQGQKIKYYENSHGDFYQLIRGAMLEKMKQNPEVRRILLKTGNLKLRPDHHQEPTSPPAWRYFEIWTEIRDSLSKSVDAHLSPVD